MQENNTELKNITGAGGKGGRGGGATEAANTVKSKTLIRVLEVVSEGEIKGLVNGAQSIYFNNTPLQNVDGSYNFQNVAWDQRTGLPSQPYMEGFPSAQAEYGVGTVVTNANPAIYTTTGPMIDAVRCTLLFPNGLCEQSMRNGNLTGSIVDVAFEVSLGTTGTWQTVATRQISEKTNSAYEIAFRIERPVGTGAWSVRVRRITIDSDTANIRNDFQLARVVEIQDVKLEYNDTAYIGIAVDAESVGSSIPKRAYLIDGVKCKIPSNYDPATATYTGIWNGEFKTDVTDNPAWVLYDMLTNERYGYGEFVSEDEIDKYSFYDAAVYNDELVPDGNGGQERRFTFNTVIAAQEDSVKSIQAIAGSFRSTLIKEGALYRVNQDRPSDPVKLITKANVIDGKFTYQSTSLQERHTVATVTYNDKNDRYLRATVTYEGPQAQIDRYGWNVIEANAYGATTPGQALRQAKWLIDTETNLLDLASWSSSFNQMDLRIGDVVKVFDEDYAGVTAAGRIVSVTEFDANTYKIELDRAFNFEYHLAQFQWNTVDGRLDSAGFLGEIGLTDTIYILKESIVDFPPAAGQDFLITQAVQARLFRVMNLSYGDQPNIINVTAVQYDPNKYSRVEQGINVPAPVYTAVNLNHIPEVKNVSFRVASKVTDEGVRRSLLVSWTPPYSTILSHYTVIWKKDNGGSNAITKVYSSSVEIENLTDGTYDVNVIAHTINGTQNNGTRASYVYSLSGGTGSTLLQPTNLRVKGTTTSTFATQSLEVEFTNPSANAQVPDAVLKDFVLSVRDTADNLIRTEFIDPVASGEKQTYLYSFDRNKADGGPRRIVKITVAARDTSNKITNATLATFSNPVPDAPTIDVKAGVKSLMIETNRSSSDDYAGTIIWASTATNFTPSDATKIYQGTNTFYIHENVSGTWYYKAAHYDSFGSTGLNTSSQGVGTASSAAGVTTVTALPADPSVVGGQQVIYLDVADTSKRGLYAWNGTSWAYTRDGANLIANSVTADKLTVANLAAISANMGNVTAGTLTLDQKGYIRGGATSFSAGTGFWQGYDNGYYKFRVGTPGGARWEYNGTAFNTYDSSGNLTISSGAVQYGFISGKPTSLSAINSTESTKLAGILDNAGKVIDGGTGTAAGQRQSDDPPSYYPVGKTLQFKWSTSVGISDGGTWITVETNKQYGDNSGGMMTQWAYAQNGSTYKRSGFPANAAWSTGWTQDLDRNVYTGDLNATWGATNATLNVGLGVNLLPNTELLNNNIAPCVMGWNPGNCTLSAGAVNGPDWVPLGGNALMIYQGARNGNEWNIGADIYPTGGFATSAYGIPVVAGKRYELSVKIANHRAGVEVAAYFYDATGNHLGGMTAGSGATRTSGGKTLANWNQLVCFSYAPANAAYSTIYFRKQDTDAGQTDSYAWFTQPYFGIATDAQTVASAYTPGTSYSALTSTWSGVSGSGKPQDNATVGAAFGVNISGQITPATVSTYIADAAINSAQIQVASIGTVHIQNGAINNARIGDAEVSTLKIAGNAVTVPTFASGVTGASGTIYLNADAWVSIIFGGQIPAGLTLTGARTVVMQIDGVTKATATAAYASSGNSSATEGFGAYLSAGSHTISVACPGSVSIFVQATGSKR